MTSQRHNADDPESTGSEDVVRPVRDIPVAVADAVRESVLAVGFRRTTLTDVARRAGVSRMTLYRVVPDVQSLLLDVMTQDLGTLLSEIEAGVARRRTARARLVAQTVEAARRLPEEPLFRRVLDVDPELLLPYLTLRVGSTQRLALERIRRVIGDGHADRSIRRGDRDVMASSYLMTVVPWIVSARLLDEVGREAALGELDHGLDGWLRP